MYSLEFAEMRSRTKPSLSFFFPYQKYDKKEERDLDVNIPMKDVSGAEKGENGQDNPWYDKLLCKKKGRKRYDIETRESNLL